MKVCLINLKEGITGLKNERKELTQLIEKANNEYYCNDDPIMTIINMIY